MSSMLPPDVVKILTDLVEASDDEYADEAIVRAGASARKQLRLADPELLPRLEEELAQARAQIFQATSEARDWRQRHDENAAAVQQLQAQINTQHRKFKSQSALKKDFQIRMAGADDEVQRARTLLEAAKIDVTLVLEAVPAADSEPEPDDSDDGTEDGFS